MQTNIALVWAEHIINILNQHGVYHFCLAPGARSTPLVMALSQNRQIKVSTHFDERALGFFALGVAKATENPVAIITTSGSAVANLLPSAVEATHAHVPLVFLTADRPQELHDCGANQAINQDAIFGTFVKKFEALPVPCSAIELSSILTKVGEVIQVASVADRGPVHINCPFREPFLEPNEILKNNFQDNIPLNQHYQTKIRETTNKPVQFNSKSKSKSILGICGWLPYQSDYEHVTQFCKERSVPLIAEIHAGVGDGFGMVDLMLAELKKSEVDQVLLFGSHIISKELLKFLKEHQHVLQLSGVYREVDPTRSFDVVNGPLIESIQENTCFGNKKFYEKINALFKLKKSVLNQSLSKNFTEITVINRLFNIISTMDINCFISNSLNSRICNSFVNSETFKGSFLNRGASGIDGNIASAIGCAKGNKKDVLAIVGDLTLLYDMNALALAKQVEHNIKICVINNQGGAIFNALKHVKDPRVLDKYFKTTHTFSFSGLAKQFDFEYFCIDERETMEDRLTGFVNNQTHSLCEVKINEAETFAHIKELTINFL